MQLRASLKFIRLSYFLCLILAVAIAVYLVTKGNSEVQMWWLEIVPGVLLLYTSVRHIERRLIKLEILGDRLRYQSGFLSKSTRTVELVKVQDVRVDQTFGQRMVNVGDLSFETAGQGSGIVIRSIDSPQEAADHILSLARAQRAKPEATGTHPEAAGV